METSLGSNIKTLFSFFFFSLVFQDRVSSVTLEPVLGLALGDQAGLELTKIHLPLPPKC